MPARHRLPLWAWVLPFLPGMAAVLAWWVWCSTERGTWVGGLLIAITGVCVYAVALEGLPRRRRGAATIRRTALAVALGLAGAGITFLAAGLGYYLRCRPFG